MADQMRQNFELPRCQNEISQDFALPLKANSLFSCCGAGSLPLAIVQIGYVNQTRRWIGVELTISWMRPAEKGAPLNGCSQS